MKNHRFCHYFVSEKELMTYNPVVTVVPRSNNDHGHYGSAKLIMAGSHYQVRENNETVFLLFVKFCSCLIIIG